MYYGLLTRRRSFDLDTASVTLKARLDSKASRCRDGQSTTPREQCARTASWDWAMSMRHPTLLPAESVGHAVGSSPWVSLALPGSYVRCTPNRTGGPAPWTTRRNDRDPIEAEGSASDVCKELQSIPGEPQADIIDVEEEGLRKTSRLWRRWTNELATFRCKNDCRG
jgi:hypothetical protein